jgi:hypothetical protein
VHHFTGYRFISMFIVITIIMVTGRCVLNASDLLQVYSILVHNFPMASGGQGPPSDLLWTPYASLGRGRKNTVPVCFRLPYKSANGTLL